MQTKGLNTYKDKYQFTSWRMEFLDFGTNKSYRKMRPSDIIQTQINYCGKVRGYNCQRISEKELMITYRMSIPSWCNDNELIKSENWGIMYSKDSKLNTETTCITFTNKDDDYHKVSNKKALQYHKRYNISDIMLLEQDLFEYLTSEKESVFREVKANIVLEKVQDLTKEWDDLTSNKRKDYSKRPNYGENRYLSGIYYQEDTIKLQQPKLPF